MIGLDIIALAVMTAQAAPPVAPPVAPPATTLETVTAPHDTPPSDIPATDRADDAAQAAAAAARALDASPPAPATTPTAPPAPGAAPDTISDPLEKLNRFDYRISLAVDRFFIHPATMIYTHILPHPLRDGVHNAVGNFNEPIVFVNDVLQLRPRRALRTALRFLINTTLGIGGLFDVAKRPYIKLVHHENGFADTLGYYGIPAGPYIYLPVIGPSSPRDLVGGLADLVTQPRLLGKMVNPDNDKPLIKSSIQLGTYGAALYIAGGLDERDRNDDALRALKAGSVDPYAAMRAAWVQARAGEIAGLKAHGHTSPITHELDDPLDDPAQAAPMPAPAAR